MGKNRGGTFSTESADSGQIYQSTNTYNKRGVLFRFSLMCDLLSSKPLPPQWGQLPIGPPVPPQCGQKPSGAIRLFDDFEDRYSERSCSILFGSTASSWRTLTTSLRWRTLQVNTWARHAASRSAPNTLPHLRKV